MIRHVYRALLLPLVIVGTAGAQVSVSMAATRDYLSYATDNRCFDQQTAAGSSSAMCLRLVTGGDAYAQASSFVYSTNSIVSLVHNDLDVGMHASANAFGQQIGSIFVTGMTDASDRLLFHFFTNKSLIFLQPTDFYDASFTLQMNTPDGIAAYEYDDYPSPFGSTSSQVTQTADGADLSVDFGNRTGVQQWNYSYDLLATLSSAVGEEEWIQANFDIGIGSADLVDANGTVRESLVFQSDGNMTLDVVSTPEPSSVALLLTGLVAAAMVAHRRRARRRGIRTDVHQDAMAR